MDFGGNVTAIVKGAPVSFKGDVAIEKLKKSELELVLFSVTMNQMKNAVNKSTNALENLKDYGKDARIAIEVFIILEAKLATEITISGSVDIRLRKVK